jgi:hypothetical protein
MYPFHVSQLDENGAEINRAEWCHIHFLYFCAKAETNSEILRKYMKIDNVENIYGTNMIHTWTKN